MKFFKNINFHINKLPNSESTNSTERKIEVFNISKFDELTNNTLEMIKKLLKTSTKRHYSKLSGSIEADSIYGYTLYTSDDASNVGPVANKVSDFCKTSDDPMYNYYRYGAMEWNEWDDLGLFTEVNLKLGNLMANYSDDIDFCELREQIFLIFLQVLTELKSEGLFDNMSSDSFLIVWVSDSDSDIMSNSAKLLNNEKVYLEYSKEFCI